MHDSRSSQIPDNKGNLWIVWDLKRGKRPFSKEEGWALGSKIRGLLLLESKWVSQQVWVMGGGGLWLLGGAALMARGAMRAASALRIYLVGGWDFSACSS